MRRPLCILTFLCALGLGSVFFMPDRISILPSAVVMAWPNSAGDWVKVRDTKASLQEVAILAKDTEFAKAEFVHAKSGYELSVGIVLSGMDPNNSIHRPERCLIAQGHSNLTSSAQKVPLSNNLQLPAMRLYTQMARQIPTESGVPEMQRVNFLTYYWFVGNNTVTESHYVRTMKDMSDRFFYGANQRWAYITVAVALRDNPSTRDLGKNHTDNPVDATIRDFLATVVPSLLKPGMIQGTKVP